jgi:hypothetical protein
MTHRSADRLSEAIDRWLGSGQATPDVHLGDVAKALMDAFPEVSDELARERVRRRLAGFNPHVRSPQELLLERASDGIERLANGLSGDDYVPWPTVAGAAAVVVVAVGVLVYLRRRGADPSGA